MNCCDLLSEMTQFLLDKVGRFFPVRDVRFHIEWTTWQQLLISYTLFGGV